MDTFDRHTDRHTECILRSGWARCLNLKSVGSAFNFRSAVSSMVYPIPLSPAPSETDNSAHTHKMNFRELATMPASSYRCRRLCDRFREVNHSQTSHQRCADIIRLCCIPLKFGPWTQNDAPDLTLSRRPAFGLVDSSL